MQEQKVRNSAIDQDRRAKCEDVAAEPFDALMMVADRFAA
jgi:hypothetical protein